MKEQSQRREVERNKCEQKIKEREVGWRSEHYKRESCGLCNFISWLKQAGENLVKSSTSH